MTTKPKTARAQAADAVEDVIAEATQKAKRARASVGAKASTARATVDRAAHEAADLAQSLGERDVVTDIRDFARRHPGATIACAAIAGAALSQIILRAARR